MHYSFVKSYSFILSWLLFQPQDGPPVLKGKHCALLDPVINSEAHMTQLEEKLQNKICYNSWERNKCFWCFHFLEKTLVSSAVSVIWLVRTKVSHEKSELGSWWPPWALVQLFYIFSIWDNKYSLALNRLGRDVWWLKKPWKLFYKSNISKWKSLPLKQIMERKRKRGRKTERKREIEENGRKGKKGRK